MLYSVITTIQSPTPCVEKLATRLSGMNGRLIVVGDKKGPDSFTSTNTDWPVEFLSLDDQNSAGFSITANLPTGHYARKNVAYLHAMHSGASCIYETDDDNAPNEKFIERQETIDSIRRVVAPNADQPGDGWVNVYKYFTDDNIWPRGLPLNEIRTPLPETTPSTSPICAPIQQGLVNGSPDVDAIWRLVMDRPFEFQDKTSVQLPPGAWCPFNTQSTWWWPIAYPLLYIPSYCSFRMCDIWKSFVAQRCIWAMGLGIVFHAAEVDQDRNEHDLQKDFMDEVPGYEHNRTIAKILEQLNLSADPTDTGRNLKNCYESLVTHGIFPSDELVLVDSWLEDCRLTVS